MFRSGMVSGEVNMGAIIGTIIDGMNGIAGVGAGLAGVMERLPTAKGFGAHLCRSRAWGSTG